MPSKRVLEATTGSKRIQEVRKKSRGDRSERHEYENEEVRHLQKSIREFLTNLLTRVPFLDGTMLEITFTAGLGLIQTVPTKLNGPIRGFFVIDLVRTTTSSVIITRSDTETAGAAAIGGAQLETHAKFIATNPCKAKIWVWT